MATGFFDWYGKSFITEILEAVAKAEYERGGGSTNYFFKFVIYFSSLRDSNTQYNNNFNQ